jgi:hypothetical protein
MIMNLRLLTAALVLISVNFSCHAQWSRTSGGLVYTTSSSDVVAIGGTSGMVPSHKLEVVGTFAASSFRDRDDLSTSYIVDPASTSHLNTLHARIFRDQDNSNYYVDPASTSFLNQLSIGSYIDLGFNKPIYFGDPLVAGHGFIQTYLSGPPKLHLRAPGQDITGANPAGDIILEAGTSLEDKGGDILIMPGSGVTMTGSIYLSPYTSGNVGVGYSATTSLQAKVDVNGSVRASSYVTVSDGTLKERIKTIDSGLEKILSLRGVQYRFKKTEGLDLPQGHQIGFIAQEVERIVPDAVFTDASGLKGVDYNKIIPVLVEAIKEQQIQIKRLSDQLELAKNSDSQLKPSDNRLYQNVPNPTNKNTLIKFDLGEDVVNSTIVIYDMQGKQLKRFSVDKKSNSIEINSGELVPGLYLYSLITNGTEVDTKRMIITD